MFVRNLYDLHYDPLAANRNVNTLVIQNVNSSDSARIVQGNEGNIRSKDWDINVLCWNIRGMTDKMNDPDTQSALFRYDIIMLTETHSEQQTEDLYNCIPGFSYRDFPRKFKHRNAPKASGGIGIYVRSTLSQGVELFSSHESVVWVKLKSSYFKCNQDKYIACVYFSPQDSSYIHSTTSRTDYFNILAEEIANKPSEHVYICGDLNARTGQRNDYVVSCSGKEGDMSVLLDQDVTVARNSAVTIRFSRDSVVNDYGKNLLSFCQCTGFRIMNGRKGNIQNTGDYTCYKSNGGASVVDYLLCRPNDMTSLSDFSILDKRAESDHRPLNFSLRLPHREIETRDKDRDGNQIAGYRWDKEKLELYQNCFDRDECQEKYDLVLLEPVDSQRNSDDLCAAFHSYIHSAISTTFNRRRQTGDRFPRNKWFNEECKALKRQLHDYSKTWDISDPEHAQRYREIEIEYRRVIQKAKRQHVEAIKDQLENFSSKNPQEYWKLWKSLKPRSVNNSNLTLGDFEEYFRTQIYPPSVEYFDVGSLTDIELFIEQFDNYSGVAPEHSLADDICNSTITMDEIRYHVKRLKNNKAAGNDGLVGEFLKYAPESVIEALCITFNGIFDRGEWPKEWVMGLINPVHKKNSVNECDNYRKVTVMPVIGKVLEAILNSRLVYKNVVLDIDDPYQFGFMKDSRTTDNIFILNTMIECQKARSKPLWVCFVDFTKAFDYVNRIALYYKLIQRGVNGKILKIIMDMYSKAKCRVKWQGKVGEELNSEYGVLQGGMMSPRLFTEYLSDMENYLDKSDGVKVGNECMNYLLYADDMVLCLETSVGLQNLINGLYSFCRKWHLIVSISKTKVIAFGRKEADRTFTFGSEILDMTQEYKYLGTIFSSDRNCYKKNQPNIVKRRMLYFPSLRTLEQQ